MRLLIERGADLSASAKLPGHYEQLGELVECTPLQYAQRFEESRSDEVMALLRGR